MRWTMLNSSRHKDIRIENNLHDSDSAKWSPSTDRFGLINSQLQCSILRQIGVPSHSMIKFGFTSDNFAQRIKRILWKGFDTDYAIVGSFITLTSVSTETVTGANRPKNRWIIGTSREISVKSILTKGSIPSGASQSASFVNTAVH